ncbi:MAG TPA: hypothetical protein VNV61_04120 [Steroidobacteraceae bacterium]|jgi:hypothetical protein|nr:hypothetical protein [Steroidobacteraceae bacterium]
MDTASPTGATEPQQAEQPGLPSDAEKEALNRSGPLIRFASENVKDLDKTLVLAISQARKAEIDKTWSPATSAEFWLAFNALCTLIKPVTIDGLSAEHRNIPVKFRVRFWRVPINESLGERSSRRYTIGLLTLLGMIVVFQLITWVYANLSGALDENAKTLRASSAELQSRCTTLAPKTTDKDGKGHQWTDDETTSYDGIVRAEGAMAAESIRLLESSRFLADILPVHFEAQSQPAIAREVRSDWALTCDAYIQNAAIASGYAAKVSERARLLSGIMLQFLLPVLLGTIGAIAYVLRSTSEQIKSTTFLTTSPVRNLVRIVLGALMGVVIGLFTNLSTTVDLQPLAFAFLAGYGVEPVFSLFDALISRLK